MYHDPSLRPFPCEHLKRLLPFEQGSAVALKYFVEDAICPGYSLEL